MNNDKSAELIRRLRNGGMKGSLETKAADYIEELEKRSAATTAAQPLDLDKLEAQVQRAYMADARCVAFLSPGTILDLIAQARTALPAQPMPPNLADFARHYEKLRSTLHSITAPADAGCGCSFPCRCNTPEAEAINAESMRDEAAEVLRATPETSDFIEKLAAQAHHAARLDTTTSASAESFAEWLAREMPSGTVIGDPAWWAPRILARATLAPVASQQAAAVAATSEDARDAALKLARQVLEKSYSKDVACDVERRNAIKAIDSAMRATQQEGE